MAKKKKAATRPPAVSDDPPKEEDAVEIDMETKANAFEQIVVKAEEVEELRAAYSLAKDKALARKKTYDESSVELTDLIKKLAEPIGPLFEEPQDDPLPGDEQVTVDPPEEEALL